jgi:predicted esterase
MITLLCIHGYRQCGATLERDLGPLASSLREHATLLFPDAPHLAEEPLTPPNTLPPSGSQRRWWSANDDGGSYLGSEVSFTLLRELADAHQPCAVLGFSQGAMVAAALSAMAQRGAFPELRFAVLIAGARPRASSLAPYFEAPVAIDSLHIWGTEDVLMGDRPERLASLYDPARRSIATWGGGHELPQTAALAQRLVDFVRERA